MVCFTQPLEDKGKRKLQIERITRYDERRKHECTLSSVSRAARKIKDIHLIDERENFDFVSKCLGEKSNGWHI